MMMTTTMDWTSPAAQAEPAMFLSKPTSTALLGSRTRPLPNAAGLELGDHYWRRALQVAGLQGLMDSPAVQLVLVPCDRAFIDLLHEMKLSWAALCADLPRLRHLLLGHVLTGTCEIDLHSAGGMLRSSNQGIIQLCGTGRVRDAQGRQAQLLGLIQGQSPGPGPGPGGTMTGQQHLIDRVLRPAEQGLLDLLADKPDHSEFLLALRQTGLASWLSGGGPFTVLAPSNVGWSAQLAHLQAYRPSLPTQAEARLKALLSRHIFAGRWLSDEMPWGGAMSALSGESLRLSPLGLLGDGPCSQALLSGSDKLARNGVLHRLARPLIPHH